MPPRKSSNEGDIAKLRMKQIVTFPPVERIPTPSIMFNWITGGGIPLGHITTISGPEHSGKTTLAHLSSIEAARLGMKVAFIDVERRYNRKWAEKLGLDSEFAGNVHTYYPDVAEDILADIPTLAHMGYKLIVIDSIAAMTPRAEMEGDPEDNQMMLLARMLSKGFRKIMPTLYTHQVGLFAINQIRSTPDMYNPIVEPGGKALLFYPSIRLRTSKLDKPKTEADVNDDGTVRFVDIGLKNLKNSTAMPFRAGDITLRFEPYIGIDIFSEMIHFASKYGLFTNSEGEPYKGGNAYAYYKGEKVGDVAGNKGIQAALHKEPEFQVMLYKDIMSQITKDMENE